ncbi:hypothetical protein FNU76_01210 [Chitinimonas arctica]|uniref:ATP-grasp domain-containing protein n=1 Tax=Chitinimonas arctica TaxID=2594795 RepID=A0A516SAA3_9NEIS|nr:hypothetical protein [Chitinimonas arctica]QDQ25079.1 hypothetical protein FNU76_01210 [Chitinimonas arctica]
MDLDEEDGDDTVVHVIEHVVVALHHRLGRDASLVCLEGFERRIDNSLLACACRDGALAGQVLEQAVRLVARLISGETVDLAVCLAVLGAELTPCSLTQAIIDAAYASGVPYFKLYQNAAVYPLYQLGWGSKQHRLHAGLSGQDCPVALGIACNRELSKSLLHDAGLPVPEGGVAESYEAALALAVQLGGLVAVRPGRGELGEGCCLRIVTEPQLRQAFFHAAALTPRVMVERYVEGQGYQVLVADGRVVEAARRPGETALDKGEVRLHPDNADDCIRAVQCIGLTVACVDLVCRDPAQPLLAQGGALVDVNPEAGRPGRPWSAHAVGLAGSALLERWFVSSQASRIPLVALLGEPATSAAALVAAALGEQGLRTGHANRYGVLARGRRVDRQGCSAFNASRSVLSAIDTEAVVLELSQDDVLVQGLAFDRCDVAILLGNHAGPPSNGRAARLLLHSATRAVVLHAADSLAAAQLPAGTEPVLFAETVDCGPLQAHIDAGRRAVYLNGSDIVIAAGPDRWPLLPIVQLAAEYRAEIGQSLAAIAALMVLVCPLDAMRKALQRHTEPPLSGAQSSGVERGSVLVHSLLN